MHERDVGLWIGRNLVVQPILIAPEIRSTGKIASLSRLIKAQQIATGAKCAVAFCVNQYVFDRRIKRPVIERFLDQKRHTMGQGIHRLGASQRYMPDASVLSDANRAHPLASARTLRAVNMRMISFVPSRI